MQDLRYGFRMLRRSPAITCGAVLSLALGIGANTSIFTIVDALLLRTMPLLEDPERLVSVYSASFNPYEVSTYPDYVDYRDRNEVFSGLIAHRTRAMHLTGADSTERIRGALVTGNYFTTLGVEPALGRTFAPEEDRTPGSHPVVVLNHGLWKSHFASDPEVLGKQIVLNGAKFTVIGVLPEGFRGARLTTPPDVWVPIMMTSHFTPKSWGLSMDSRGWGWLQITGRLRPGVTLSQAQANMSVIADQISRDHPRQSEGLTVMLVPLQQAQFSPVARTEMARYATVLVAVVGLVWLIACVNVANLLLARASARRTEIAIRLAMGASRLRLIRQLLTESVLLSLLGGGAALLVVVWCIPFLRAVPLPPELHVNLNIDQRVLVFTLLLSLLTGLVFGLAPALRSARPDLVPALRRDLPVRGGVRGLTLRKSLLAGQLALSLLLLIGAGLFLKSLQNIYAVDVGFDAEKVLTAAIDLGPQGYDAARIAAFYGELVARVRELPSVQSVSLAHVLPVAGGDDALSIGVPGYEPGPDERMSARFCMVGVDYFRTLGIPLIAGRDFSTQPSHREIIVNETMARRYWPGGDATGKEVKLDGPDGPNWTVVGTVKDSKYVELREEPRPFFYLANTENNESTIGESMILLVRSSTDPMSLLPTIGREVAALDSHLPVFDAKPLSRQLAQSILPNRLVATVLGLFAVLALTLALVGLYGVTTYSVNLRSQEIGVRIALGAQRRDVLKLVLYETAGVVVLGAAGGLALAFAATRVATALLFRVSPLDPTTFLLTAVLLCTAAAVASYLPARRATALDPVVTLRYE
jgi:predicted permease